MLIDSSSATTSKLRPGVRRIDCLGVSRPAPAPCGRRADRCRCTARDAFICATMCGPVAEQARIAMVRGRREPARLQATEDFREGITAMSERRPPHFTGR